MRSHRLLLQSRGHLRKLQRSLDAPLRHTLAQRSKQLGERGHGVRRLAFFLHPFATQHSVWYLFLSKVIRLNLKYKRKAFLNNTFPLLFLILNTRDKRSSALGPFCGSAFENDPQHRCQLFLIRATTQLYSQAERTSCNQKEPGSITPLSSSPLGGKGERSH